MSVVEKEALPGKLDQALARAKSRIPSVAELQTEAGLAESLSALAGATRLDAATQKALDTWNDKNNLHFLIRGADFAGFNRKWKQMGSRGFHLADLETFVDARGKRRWDGLFLPGAQRGHLARTETTESFAQKWRDLGSQGLQLIDIETYVDDGQRKWAGVFVGGSGPYALWRNASRASFEKKVAEWSDRKLIDVETYEENGQQRWVGVWSGRASGAPKMTLETPATELPDGWSKDADPLLEHESYLDASQRRSIAIWSRP